MNNALKEEIRLTERRLLPTCVSFFARHRFTTFWRGVQYSSASRRQFSPRLYTRRKCYPKKLAFQVYFAPPRHERHQCPTNTHRHWHAQDTKDEWWLTPHTLNFTSLTHHSLLILHIIYSHNLHTTPTHASWRRRRRRNHGIKNSSMSNCSSLPAHP